MPEAVQIAIGFLAVTIVYILTMLGRNWWTRRICLTIIKELEEKGAYNERSAVTLPYDKTNIFQVGYRDYRPKALESLILSNLVIRTSNGQYYLDKDKLWAMKNQLAN